MKVDHYAWDSMYNQGYQNCKGTITVDMGTPDQVTNPHRMYDSLKNIKPKKIGPVPGEVWHYKLSGARALMTGLVKEVTAHTVVIARNKWDDGTRYVTEEVYFVEKSHL